MPNGENRVECDNESEVEGAHGIEDDDAYSINIGYLSDGEGDEELQAAKDNLRVGIGKDRPKIKQHREGSGVESDNENSSEENDTKAEIHRETYNEG
ncbi:hypothetical protein V6N13_059195 [Hibiscus sabdariffa]